MTQVKLLKTQFNTETFIKRAKEIHGDKYIYDEVNYVNSSTKVKIICPIHGPFYVTPKHHIYSKSGCVKCAGRNKRTTEEFKELAQKVHGNKYDYSLVNYTRSIHNVTIICPIHGEFEQTPSRHLFGAGCPKCRLKNQMLLLEKLTKIFDSDTFIWEYTSSWLGKQRIDICMIDYKIAIEYDGLQHYEPIEFFGGQKEFQRRIKLDAKKDELCKKNGFYMFRMKYNYTEEDFYNLCKQIEKIKNTDDPDKLIKKTV